MAQSSTMLSFRGSKATDKAFPKGEGGTAIAVTDEVNTAAIIHGCLNKKSKPHPALRATLPKGEGLVRCKFSPILYLLSRIFCIFVLSTAFHFRATGSILNKKWAAEFRGPSKRKENEGQWINPDQKILPGQWSLRHR